MVKCFCTEKREEQTLKVKTAHSVSVLMFIAGLMSGATVCRLFDQCFANWSVIEDCLYTLRSVFICRCQLM